MNVILVDDEPFALEYLESLCAMIPELHVQACFGEVCSALDYVHVHRPGLVILDIDMPGMTGIEAARALRREYPAISVIFVTGYEQFALQAFQAEAVAYLLKPCSLPELQSAVKRALKLSAPAKKRVELKTFGLFGVLIDGAPYRFSNSKALELLALLTDRAGGIVTMEQAADLLWEDRPYDEMVKRLYRKAVMYLHQVCREQEVDFFLSNRGSCHILPDKVDCDYYDLMRGSLDSARQYCGEYMAQYAWAEPANGKILQFLDSMKSQL